MADEVVFSVVDVITLICIVVRIFVRYYMTSTMEMDDWVVVVMVIVWAIFLSLGHYSTISLPNSNYQLNLFPRLMFFGSVRIVAMGRDIWDVDPRTVTSVLRVSVSSP